MEIIFFIILNYSILCNIFNGGDVADGWGWLLKSGREKDFEKINLKFSGNNSGHCSTIHSNETTKRFINYKLG